MFSQYGFLGSLVRIVSKFRIFGVEAAGHDVVLEISLVTPMRLVLKQISTSHADFVMAGKARHTSMQCLQFDTGNTIKVHIFVAGSQIGSGHSNRL